MSSIFHGGNTYIFYNTDANNNIPTSVTYKNIDELGSFPQVKINSSTTSIETYNDEWVQVLSGNMSIDSVSIVVHYIATNESHQFLDSAFSNLTNFQIKVSLYESQDSLDQHYVILNGYISGFSDSGDQNEVYNRTYTFVAEDLITRGTAQDPPQLKQGDFGIGADGETYPQYESETPTGNSFIKVPALRTDNPINGDLGGFAFVDNGGDKTAQLAMPSEGNLGIYIKNTDHDWLSVPLKATNDAIYVPLTRTINGKVLSSNITLSASDVSALPLSGGTLTGALTGTDATYNGTVQANDLTLTNALPVTQGGTGNNTGNAPTATLAASSTKLATSRTVRTNLASTSTASFDGSANITPGVTGTLSIANGGTGNTTGLAASATKLATARTVTINLASSTAGSFDGTSNITPGVSGILGLANGGTGAATADDALVSLGIKALGLGADTLTTITDFNTVTISGLYRYTSTTTNSPFSGQSGTMIHLPYSTAYCSQMAFHIGQTTASVNPQIYQRVMVQGAWSTWKQYAGAGINSDITSFTALSGPLTLGGDAQQDAQAVTLRQLTAATAGGGSNGATLNGVMNNFLGAVEWFNGTRAALPAGHVAADGQLLNRADYPDIWNAINTGVFKSVTDANWLLTTGANRGMYSTGNGSTTFRMPDLNGVQTNSIASPFLRGNAGTSAAIAIHGDTGTVMSSGIPNITGSFNIAPDGANVALANNQSGAFSAVTPLTAVAQIASGSGAVNRAVTTNFDASRITAVYGSSTEVRPNSVVGIWLIRVNGKFSAANTNFNVINGINSTPASGSVTYGGSVVSNLQLNGTDYVVGRMRAKNVGAGTKGVSIDVVDSTSSTIVTSTLDINGGASGSSSVGVDLISTSGELGLYSSGSASVRLRADGSARMQNSDSSSAIDLNAAGINLTGHLRGTSSQIFAGQYISINSAKVATNGEIAIFNSNADTTVGVRFGMVNLASGNSRRFYAGDINGSNQLVQTLPNSTGTITVSTSDKNLKTFTGDVDAEDAVERIMKLQPVEFNWNEKFTNDPDILDKPRRGFFAQDAFEIDERYAVKPTQEQEAIDIVWGLEDRAIMADMVATIQLMSTQIANLQSQIDTLKTGANQ